MEVDEFATLSNTTNVVTTITLPVGLKEHCRKLGIRLRECVLDGIRSKLLNSNEIQKLQQENMQLSMANEAMSKKLYDTIFRVRQLEEKNKEA